MEGHFEVAFGQPRAKKHWSNIDCACSPVSKGNLVFFRRDECFRRCGGLPYVIVDVDYAGCHRPIVGTKPKDDTIYLESKQYSVVNR